MSSPNEIILYLGADTIVSLGMDRPLHDNSTDPPTPIVGGATVTGVLKDKDGVVLGGGLVFSYVTGTVGQWDANVADDYAGLALNMRGTIEITADAGGAKKLFAELNFHVRRYQGEA